MAPVGREENNVPAMTTNNVKGLNVIVMGNGADDWLSKARDRVECEEPAGDEAGVNRAIEKLLQRTPKATAIEFISHSQKQNCLKIGSWVIDENAFKAASTSLKNTIDKRVVRVVGCATAIGDEANYALEAISANLGIKDVYGTGGLVGLPDLYQQGTRPTIRPELMKKPRHPRHTEPFTVTGTELERGGRPRAFAESDREFLANGLNSADKLLVKEAFSILNPTHYYTFPGILREPTKTIVLGPEPAKTRLDVLFRDQLLRVTRAQLGQKPVEYLFLLPMRVRKTLRQRFDISEIN